MRIQVQIVSPFYPSLDGSSNTLLTCAVFQVLSSENAVPVESWICTSVQECWRTGISPACQKSKACKLLCAVWQKKQRRFVPLVVTPLWCVLPCCPRPNGPVWWVQEETLCEWCATRGRESLKRGKLYEKERMTHVLEELEKGREAQQERVTAGQGWN